MESDKRGESFLSPLFSIENYENWRSGFQFNMEL